MKKISLMHQIYGREMGKCGDCTNLEECQGHQKVYYKCRLYGDSNSSATDWVKGWQACGMKNKEPKGRQPIFRGALKKKAPDHQVPGQMNLSDFL